MRILFSSHPFSPSIGGIETVSELLAAEFCRAGHEVKLITETATPDAVARPFDVVRRPSAGAMISLLRWCDVFFHNNISLRAAWPLLVIRRPWVIAHHTWIPRAGIASRVKRFVLRLARNISISQAIAADIGVPSAVVGNPYRDDAFFVRKDVARDTELVFLGRLVSDKGADLLIEALAALRSEGITARLTIIGSGPEEMPLRALAANRAVSDLVTFTGPRHGEELARLLSGHQILAVPSRWAEPFGMVALEGIACGCVVVASRAGGLPDAVGPCGLTFENGNVRALTEALRTLLQRPELRADLRQHSDLHLSQFTPPIVTMKYLRVFQDAINEG